MSDAKQVAKDIEALIGGYPVETFNYMPVRPTYDLLKRAQAALTESSPSVDANDLGEALFEVTYPQGFWLQGYNEPYEADYYERAVALLKRFDITPKAE